MGQVPQPMLRVLDVLIEDLHVIRLAGEMDLGNVEEAREAVIAARVFEGKKFREVAAALGCPLNTALARMHEGLKKLRQLWEARHA